MEYLRARDPFIRRLHEAVIDEAIEQENDRLQTLAKQIANAVWGAIRK